MLFQSLRVLFQDNFPTNEDETSQVQSEFISMIITSIKSSLYENRTIQHSTIVFTNIQTIFVSRSPSIEELEELSPEYLEIVNFVNLGWSSVKNELEQGDFVEDNTEDGYKNYSLR